MFGLPRSTPASIPFFALPIHAIDDDQMNALLGGHLKEHSGPEHAEEAKVMARDWEMPINFMIFVTKDRAALVCSHSTPQKTFMGKVKRKSLELIHEADFEKPIRVQGLPLDIIRLSALHKQLGWDEPGLPSFPTIRVFRFPPDE